MSTDCCDYGCTRAPNCPAGSVVAEKLLAGEKLPELESRVDHVNAASAQWFQHPKGAPRTPIDRSFRPLYNHPAPAKPSRLTGKRVLIGCGVFLAVCVAGFSTLLYFFR